MTGINNDALYIVGFKDQAHIFKEFEVPCEDREGVRILFAAYAGEDYDGQAFVLFDKDNKLYEVNGSHCSWYGLEGQWEPELVNAEELVNRIKTHDDFLGKDSYMSFPREWSQLLLAYMNAIDRLQKAGIIMVSKEPYDDKER